MARSDARALVGIVATVVLGALQVLVQIAETPPSWLSPVLWGLIVLALAYTLWSFLPSFRKPVEQTWRTRPRVIRSQTWTDYQDLLVARESDREQIGASLLLVRKSAELSHIEKGHPYVDLTIVLTNAALEPVIVHGISGHIKFMGEELEAPENRSGGIGARYPHLTQIKINLRQRLREPTLERLRDLMGNGEPVVIDCSRLRFKLEHVGKRVETSVTALRDPWNIACQC